MYLFIVVTFAFNSNPSVIVYVSLLGSSCWHFVWSRVGCAHSFEVALVLFVVFLLFETAALFTVVVRSTTSLNNRDCFIMFCLFGSLVGLLVA